MTDEPQFEQYRTRVHTVAVVCVFCDAEHGPVHIAPWLFCTRRGECYVNEETGEAPGWKSMWQRFMARVLKETKVTAPFTEHDLRAKVGSGAESLERARALLAHADARTTQHVYRRKPERVRPLK